MADTKRLWRWKDNQHHGEENASVRDYCFSQFISINYTSFSYDCDEFTKAFYRHNFGMTDFTPIAVAAPKAHALEKVSYMP